jgi:hypothetical protein
MIPNYGKIYHFGTPQVRDIFSDPVVVEEKIDGSQFSFGLLNGELCCRSKGKQIVLDAPDMMFKRAVEVVRSVADKLIPNWVYRGEYLQKPKHNALAYDRTPRNHIMIFDIVRDDGSACHPEIRRIHADTIDLETVPTLACGDVRSMDELLSFMDRVSVLGGQKIEGFVVKNHNRYDPMNHGAFLMAKHVAPEFKELNHGNFRLQNPGKNDIADMLINMCRTEARWNKAAQHLAERGELEGSPRDIGKLIKATQSDTLEESEADIKERLWQWFKPQLARGVVRGLPEWWKRRLLDSQFGGES